MLAKVLGFFLETIYDVKDSTLDLINSVKTLSFNEKQVIALI